METKLSKDMRKISPLKFEGSTNGDEVEAWLIQMEKYFETRNYYEVTKLVWGAYQLSGEASNEWMNKKMELGLNSLNLTSNELRFSIKGGCPNSFLIKISLISKIETRRIYGK